jgi:hypothetical protein
MILKFTYQQKLKMLPYCFLVMGLLVYWIAISGTVQLKKDCNIIKDQMISMGDANAQLITLTNKLEELNKLTGDNEKGETTDPLLNFISSHSTSSVKLINFLPLHIYSKKPYLIETRIAIFEGSFMNHLTFLFNLEKNYYSGKIVSVKFETETNLKTEKKRLLMTLYIQSISNEKKSSAEPDGTSPNS